MPHHSPDRDREGCARQVVNNRSYVLSEYVKENGYLYLVSELLKVWTESKQFVSKRVAQTMREYKTSECQFRLHKKFLRFIHVNWKINLFRYGDQKHANNSPGALMLLEIKQTANSLKHTINIQGDQDWLQISRTIFPLEYTAICLLFVFCLFLFLVVLFSPDWLWSPHILLDNGYMGPYPWGYGGRDVKLTTRLHLRPGSRIPELYLRSHTS
jgi:hypothetical protein